MLGKLLKQSQLQLATMSPLFNQLHTVATIILHQLELLTNNPWFMEDRNDPLL